MDAKEAVLDILTDKKLFSNLDNLVVSPGSRWDQAQFGDCHHGELVPAAACQTYIRQKGLRAGLDLLVPLLIYQDAIATTGNGRMSVNPVIVTLGILKHSVRSTQENARLLGMIPMFDLRTKAQKSAESGRLSGKGRGVRNFHT